MISTLIQAQNTTANGYGPCASPARKSAQCHLLQMWASFYFADEDASYFPLYKVCLSIPHYLHLSIFMYAQLISMVVHRARNSPRKSHCFDQTQFGT